MKKALTLAFLLAASPVQAVMPVQAAIVMPPPGPKPLLSIAEINQGLDIEPSSESTWLVFRDHVFYACSTRANLQVVLPIFYTFDYKDGDTPATRMGIAAETDHVVQALLDEIASDPYLAQKFRSHDFSADPGTVDASTQTFYIDSYLGAYENSKSAAAHHVAFVEYHGLALAQGCGNITDRDMYRRALPQQKYLIQYSYL